MENYTGENESMANFELGGAVFAKTSASLLTKSLRGFLAVVAVGSVAAYGAISAKPELVDYLSFIPGMESPVTPCSLQTGASGCGGCLAGADDSFSGEACGGSPSTQSGCCDSQAVASEEACSGSCPHCSVAAEEQTIEQAAVPATANLPIGATASGN